MKLREDNLWKVPIFKAQEELDELSKVNSLGFLASLAQLTD